MGHEGALVLVLGVGVAHGELRYARTQEVVAGVAHHHDGVEVLLQEGHGHGLAGTGEVDDDHTVLVVDVDQRLLRAAVVGAEALVRQGCEFGQESTRTYRFASWHTDEEAQAVPTQRVDHDDRSIEAAGAHQAEDVHRVADDGVVVRVPTSEFLQQSPGDLGNPGLGTGDEGPARVAFRLGEHCFGGEVDRVAELGHDGAFTAPFLGQAGDAQGRGVGVQADGPAGGLQSGDALREVGRVRIVVLVDQGLVDVV